MEKKLSLSFVFRYKINLYVYIYNSLLNYTIKYNKIPKRINIHPEHLAQLREFLNIDYTVPLTHFKNIKLNVSERYYLPTLK